MHLRSRSVQGAGVVNHIIAGFYFFLVGELRGHAASDLLAGGFEAAVVAGGKTFYALLVAAGDHDQAIETLASANNRRQLETLLKEASHRDLTVKFVAKEGLTIKNAPEQSSKRADEFKDDPLIQEALQIFKGEIKT